NMVKAYLKKTRDSRVRSGHPWVFRSDIERTEGAFEPGDVAEVRSAAGTFLGRAFYNPNSQISLRMLTQHDEEIDAAFFHKRVEEAWAYRKRFCDTESCRAIYAESDFIPALILDKFGSV
ncbi:MAG: rRNA large subunit methyltransferase I, partial [Clostridia bacterium]